MTTFGVVFITSSSCVCITNAAWNKHEFAQSLILWFNIAYIDDDVAIMTKAKNL